LSYLLSGKGVPPLGSIIAFVDHIPGHWDLPGDNEHKDGWALCNGNSMPSGSKLSGTRPKLDDDRFLMGYTSSGSTNVGGAGSNTQSTTVDGTDYSFSFNSDYEGPTWGPYGLLYLVCWSTTHSHRVHFCMGDSGSWVGRGGSAGLDAGGFYRFSDGNWGYSYATGLWDNQAIYGGTTHSNGTLMRFRTPSDANIKTPSYKYNDYATRTTYWDGATHRHTVSGDLGSTPTTSSWNNRPNYMNMIFLIRVA